MCIDTISDLNNATLLMMVSDVGENLISLQKPAAMFLVCLNEAVLIIKYLTF